MLPDVFALLDVAAVNAFVGDRIYRHGIAPKQSPDAPYITWSVVTGNPENQLADAPGIDRFSIQVDCWSANNGTGREQINHLARAVRDQIETAHYIDSYDADLRDAETMRYRASLTFTWWYPRQS